MEAACTPVFGNGSTVMVFRACSSLTSSSICAYTRQVTLKSSHPEWQTEPFTSSVPNSHVTQSLVRTGFKQSVEAMYLVGLQRLPILIISHQPEAGDLIELVVSNQKIVGACVHDVILCCALMGV